MSVVRIGDTYFSKEEAKISVYDHGLLYGDGVFEGIRIYSGRLFQLREHLSRLYEGAKQIYLEIPSSMSELEKKVIETCRENKMQEKNGYIRLIVTRGAGNLGIGFSSCKEPQVIIIVDEISVFSEKEYQEGISVCTSSIRVKSFDHLAPTIKSLNYLGHILARQEALQASYQDAILLNQQGHVAEATVSNLFSIQDGVCLTPQTSDGILNGVTREVVLKKILPQLNLPIHEKSLTIWDLKKADEVFITGTAVEIMAVTKIDQVSIGQGMAGQFTLSLAKAFREYATKEGILI